jgi:serine/threonine-protein kinase
VAIFAARMALPVCSFERPVCEERRPYNRLTHTSMSLASGTRVGPYEVGAPLGAGGMGQVYRARDTKLGREVAIKVLPPEFAHDRERVARFQREAQLLAALNHPHIATIHGLEETGGSQFLVMELVEGGTLADRLRSGPLEVSEALTIARQVADALQAAHEKGIVHRDLKPANIAFTATGQVKVLDFGLAKALGSGDGSPHDSPSVMTHSPTLSVAATQAGVILGTAAYMAPEQARGKAADKRSDIWAFGCVLYEMFTGRRAFEGVDLTDTLAAVLRSEPDWSAVPAATPAAVHALVRGCLKKDPRARIGDVAAALFVLDEMPQGEPTAVGSANENRADPPYVRTTRRRTALVGTAALVVGGVAIGGPVWYAMRPAPLGVVRTEITTMGPTALAFQGADRDLAITPDGSRVIYRGNNALLVRALDRLEPEVLSGLGAPRGLFVSPDGEWIGFFDTLSLLKKVAITGGPAVTVSKGDSNPPRGATWAPDGTIVYATAAADTGLLRVPASGGSPIVLTKPNREDGEADHFFPEFLPDGSAVLFTIVVGSLDSAQVAVLDLATGNYKVIIRGGHHAHYVPTGHLVYGTGASLRAVPFDLERLDVSGAPVPVLEGVHTANSGVVNAAIAANGTLVYVPGGVATLAAWSLVWVSRDGREEPIPAPPRNYFALRLSPDGTRAAIDIRDQESDVWVWDFARQTLTRLTFTRGLDVFPIWTPDGRRIVFTRVGLMARAADGTGTEDNLTKTNGVALSFSPDGKQLVMTYQNDDIGLLPLDGKGEVTPLVRTMFTEGNAEVSPDGRWLAYQSNESGQDQIYVRPFPEVGSGRWQVSATGGTKPAWARNGRELVYLDSAGALVAVAIQTQPAFSVGNPTKLFDARYRSAINSRSYDVTPDGQRFLFIKNAADAPLSSSFIVVQNWFEELKRLVPVN